MPVDIEAFHTSYHPLSEIEAFISTLVSSYPTLITRKVIGRCAEGREIFALRIANDTLDGEEEDRVGMWKKKEGQKEKGVLVVSGAQHAREVSAPHLTSPIHLHPILISHVSGFHAQWIATASALYLAHALISPSPSFTTLSKLLDEYDLHLIPVPNPDGYVYTWEADRMWYKNRQPPSSLSDREEEEEEEEGEEGREECFGLDMNRNWVNAFLFSLSPSG